MTKQLATYLIGFIILMILGIGWCTERKQYAAYANAVEHNWANDTLKLTKRIKADSATIYQMQQRIGSEADARQLAQDDAKHYKSILAVVKAKAGAQKNNIQIRYVENPIQINTTDTIAIADTACIPVGTAFSYADKWFYASGILGADNIYMDSVGFNPGVIKVIIGNKKKGLFKSSQPAISLVFENPNMYAQNANNVVVKDNRKPRRGWWLVSGIAVGLIGGLLMK